MKMTRGGLEPATSRFVLWNATTAQPGLQETKAIHSHKLHHHSPNAETNLSGLFDTSLDLPKGEDWIELQSGSGGSVLEYKSRGRGFESYSGHIHCHKLSRLIFEILLLLNSTNHA